MEATHQDQPVPADACSRQCYPAPAGPEPVPGDRGTGQGVQPQPQASVPGRGAEKAEGLERRGPLDQTLEPLDLLTRQQEPFAQRRRILMIRSRMKGFSSFTNSSSCPRMEVPPNWLPISSPSWLAALGL